MKVKEQKHLQPPDNNNNYVENDMHQMIEAIAEFEDFRETVLPAIQKDLKAGLNAKELRAKYLALVQAKQLSDILMAPIGESGDLAQKVIDREEGKATEKSEVKHRFEDLPPEQLDAALLTMIKKAKK